MGAIYDSEFGSNCIGRIEDGSVYDSEYGSNSIGRVEDGEEETGGAALLLLLR
jgi:hypothetical protein